MTDKSNSMEKNKDYLIFKTIKFATKAHSGQYRKGSLVPYIIHPIRVCKILINYNCGEIVASAGVLHDVLEDTPRTRKDIKKEFGSKICTLVETVSEIGAKKTWEQRKQNTIDLLKSAPKDIILIECADKLDNIRAIVEDYERLGEHVWKKFSRPRDSQAWYYLSMLKSLQSRKFTTNAAALIKEFSQEVIKIF